MEKRKDYLLWLSLGVIYYIFIWKISQIIFMKVPKLLFAIYDILGNSYSILIAPIVINATSSIIYSIIFVMGVFAIRSFLEYDHFYFIQPILFVVGFFIIFLSFESYAYFFDYPQYLSNSKYSLGDNTLILGFKTSLYLLMITFIVSNGFIRLKKQNYFLIAIIMQFLFSFYSGSEFSSSLRFISYGRFLETCMMIILVGAYAYMSKKLYHNTF